MTITVTKQTGRTETTSSMLVSAAEARLLRRLRQLRNQAQVAAVVVFLSPMTLNPLGNTETLEALDAKPDKA